MFVDRWRLAATLCACALAVSACGSTAPSPSSSRVAAPTATPVSTATLEPTASPSASPLETTFSAAVVTGFTNPQPGISLTALTRLAANGALLVPCGITRFLGQRGTARCLKPDEIRSRLQARPLTIALLPAGLVEPKTKVLPVDSADLFGNAAARAMPYPVQVSGIGLDQAATAYDAANIRTLVSLGDSCPDRGVAYQAITLGKGWSWVMGGGTAKYTRVYPNPVGPGKVGDGYDIVSAVPTGNFGAVAKLTSGADITVDDFECPVVDDWRVNDGVVFSIDPRAVTAMRKILGIDLATLAANHLSDQGPAGLLSTLEKFDANGIAHVGAGRDLDGALDPAFVNVKGLRFAFVGFNDVPGVARAAIGTPGVAWLTEANVREAVRRARAGKADIVFCMPQWWNSEGKEYFAPFSPLQVAQRGIMLGAGCDQILGAGSHWAGAISFARDANGLHFAIGSHGNFLFGQDWSRQTQEGVILELTFRGTALAQVRLHPYIMLDQAQANLTDPLTDGQHVLRQVFDNSQLAY